MNRRESLAVPAVAAGARAATDRLASAWNGYFMTDPKPLPVTPMQDLIVREAVIEASGMWG